MEVKTCSKCGEVKPLTEFAFRSQRKGKRAPRCRTCTRAAIRAHYDAHRPAYIAKALRQKTALRLATRAWLQAYLSTHPCVDCGEADLVALDSDHVRGTKRAEVTRMTGSYSLASVIAEVAKCDVRCANCHRKRTAERREQKLLLKQYYGARSSTG